MPISKRKLQSIYRRRAKYYDVSSILYRFVGMDIEAYRSCAIKRLHLKRGDCVVDLGCGTGMNFELLLDCVGPEGRLIGVDFSQDMLARAKKRVHRHRWMNVYLTPSDIENYEFPMGVNGVLSTNVFGFIPGYDDVIKSAAMALAPGGRLVIQDGKRPAHWPERLFRMAVWLGRPYGITPAYYSGRPWKSIERYFQTSSMEEMYFGMEYIAHGENGPNHRIARH